MIPDPDFGYIHAPGNTSRRQRVDVSINREGFRGPEFAASRGDGRCRLLILGDSVVFGWGAPQDSIFPARLQRLFDEVGLPCEVIPAGVGSWNTRHEAEFMKKRGFDYSPDVLLLVIVPNDIEPSRKGRSGVSASELFPSARPTSRLAQGISRTWRVLVERSYVFSSAQHVRRVESSRVESERSRYTSGSPALRDASLALAMIAEGCKEHGVRFTAVEYADSSTQFERAFTAAYSTALDSLCVEHYRIDRVGSDGRYRNSWVDGHPNSDGHRIIAEELFGVLRPIVVARLASREGADSLESIPMRPPDPPEKSSPD